MTTGGAVRLAMEWQHRMGDDSLICEIPLIGCYRISVHREGWMQLSLESRLADTRVLVVCDNIEELKAFAASHARLMMESQG